MKPLLCLPAALALAAAIASQPGYMGGITVESRSNLDSMTGFTGIAAGLLTGAGYPDVVVLQTGTPVLFAAPATFNALVPIEGAPDGFTAIATRRLERASTQRWRDVLVGSNSDGLWHWYHDEGTGMTWVPVDRDTAWRELTRLAAAHVDGDDLQDLLAVQSDGSTVLVRLASGSAYGTQHTRTFSSAVHAVAAIEWNGTAPKEIAVATANGLEICSFASGLTTLQSIGGTSGSDATLVTARQATGADFLALTTESSGAWTMHRIMAGTSSIAASVPLGSLGIVDCAAGDIDADGDDELLYGQQVNHRVTVLLQRPTYYFSYTPADAFEVPLIGPANDPGPSSPSASTNQATPLFADLDGDDCADLVHAVESTESVVIIRNPFGLLSAAVLQTRLFHESTTEMRLSYELDASVAPPGATDFEIVAWPLTWNYGFASDGGFSPSRAFQAIPQSGTCMVSVMFPAAYQNEPTAAVLVQVRAIKINAGGIERAFKPVTYIYMHNEYGVAVLQQLPAWQDALAYKHPLLDVIEVDIGDIGGYGGGEVPVVPPPPTEPPPVGPG